VDLLLDFGAGVLDTGKRADGVDDRTADRIDLALRRIAELDVDADVSAVNADVLRRLR
jgi:hypothetical protein